jgi:Arc/MetJ-type ribon-helix-helix transcriptional regulator
MPRLPKPRERRNITLRADLHKWIEKQIGKGQFQNFSHAVDVALEKLRDSEKKENHRG